MTDSIEYTVPATSANLGPGFGVLGLALDASFSFRLEPSEEAGLSVIRPDNPGESALDPRHDSVVRGLRSAAARWKIAIPSALEIVCETEVPRGCGLGSNSAEFVGGIRAALNYAKEIPGRDEQLDLLVELGGDPAHGAAALCGGLVVAAPIHAPNAARAFRSISHDLHEDWRFVVVAPQVQIGTAEVHRVVPAALPNAVVQRTTGRLIGLLRALAEGDEDLLAPCLVDEVHVPFRINLAPGIGQAMGAAREAGAAGATISGHGPAVIALTTHAERTQEIERAMREEFEHRGIATRSLVCRACASADIAPEEEEEGPALATGG